MTAHARDQRLTRNEAEGRDRPRPKSPLAGRRGSPPTVAGAWAVASLRFAPGEALIVGVGGRHIGEAAARRCDGVLVLSLPWALRLPAARDPALLNAVSRVFFEEVRTWLRAAVGAVPGARVEAAAVTFVQRFGGSLNLNPHPHMPVADGAFACSEDSSSPRFVTTAAPTRDELREVIARVIARLETIAARMVKRADDGSGRAGDDGMEGLRQAAGGRGTFARVDERGAREGDDAERESGPLRLASRGLVAEASGFNLHAGVRVAADDRDGLERLCRYMARPAVASGRVTRLPDGNVAYRVKSPRSAGATHRVMTPMEFMARLSALVPPPPTPLVRYHGVVAPNSPWRVAVVPLPVGVAVACRRNAAAPVSAGAVSTGAASAVGAGARGAAVSIPMLAGRIDWARLMRRVWAVDVLVCPACGGRMRMIAALTERAEVVRILEHLGVSTEVPRMQRSRDGP